MARRAAREVARKEAKDAALWVRVDELLDGGDVKKAATRSHISTHVSAPHSVVRARHRPYSRCCFSHHRTI